MPAGTATPRRVHATADRRQRRHSTWATSPRALNRWLVGLLALVLAACGPDPDAPEVRVRVPPGASFRMVTDSLALHGVVSQPTLFRVYARLSKADRQVKPGTYAFRRGERWSRLLEDLRAGRFLTVRVVIPEGWDLRRIAPILAQATGLQPDSILAVLQDPETATRHGVPGPTLEGYLYPATYTIPLDLPLEAIIAQLVARYEQVWTPERLARADSLGMTEREVVTLASIVEKEARRREEMPLIAAVFHNRLEIGYPLQADPTIQYALGTHQSRLLYEHIEKVADHPYSTYHRPGLPPGPIGSPSSLAIDATLWPADADYLYFVAARDGSHVFTRTLDEHNRARAAVQRGMTPTASVPAAAAGADGQ